MTSQVIQGTWVCTDGSGGAGANGLMKVERCTLLQNNSLSSPLGPEPTTPVSPQPSPLSSNKRESARVYHNLVSDCQLEYFLGEDCR